MSMDFYLDRREQKMLRDKLALVPELVEDLAVTLTRQARISQPNFGKSRRQKPGSRIPFHLAASDAADELHTCLTTWVRFVCEERQVHYRHHDDTTTLSRWLSRNITLLALIEGSEESYADIAHHIDTCRQIVDLPPEDEIVIDQARLNAANRQILTAGQVEKIAGRLGQMASGLNKRRVETLVDNGGLKPCAKDGDVRFYRLGEVLDAHHRKNAERRAGR